MNIEQTKRDVQTIMEDGNSVKTQTVWKKHSEAGQHLHPREIRSCPPGVSNLPDGLGIGSLDELVHDKSRIQCRLINRRSNEEALKEMPHREILGDLALIYFAALSGEPADTVSIRSGMTDLPEEELYKLAMGNIKRLSPPMVRTMRNMFHVLYSGGMAAGALDSDELSSRMIVLTNRAMTNGAVYMLDLECLEAVHKTLGDFYILPSSIHEVLAIPMRELHAVDLLPMVKTVNSTEVRIEDRLSNSVYQYTEEGGLSAALYGEPGVC